MTQQVTCVCGQSFAAADHLAGQRVACPVCQAPLDIPAAAHGDEQMRLAPLETPGPSASPAPRKGALPAIRVPAAPPSTPQRRFDQKSLTLNDSARASNPGSFRVQYLHYAKHYPLWPALLGGGALLSAALMLTAGWGWAVLFALLLVANGLYWMRIRDHFLHGCANPGVILSLDPMLIAFCTDLTTGGGEYPAIKIVRKQLSQLRGDSPQVGDGLIGVALYGTSNASLPHWEDFDPKPVECATTDPQVRERLLGTMDQEDWEQLNQWLACVPQPYEPGLYLVQPEAGTARRYNIGDD